MIAPQVRFADIHERPMIDLSLSEELTAAGVEAALACLACRLRVAETAEGLGEALDEAVARATALLDGRPVAELPAVAATRRAYKALGKDPARYRPSAEALLRRVAQGKGLYRINTVVDTNNLVSLETGFSIGAYDAARIEPPALLRPGRPDEPYEAVGRGPLNIAGLPVLADRAGAFGSPTSDSTRTMITAETQSLLMVVFGFGPATGPSLESALSRAAEHLARFCGAGEIERAVVRTP